MGVWPSAFNGAAVTLHWVTNKINKSKKKKIIMINKSSANLLASVPLRPLTLAIGLRRQWNSKVKKCQKYYIRGAEGGGGGLGALLLRWLMSKTKVSSKKRTTRKTHKNSYKSQWICIMMVFRCWFCRRLPTQQTNATQQLRQFSIFIATLKRKTIRQKIRK